MDVNKEAPTIAKLVALLRVKDSVRIITAPVLFVMLAALSLPTAAQGGPPYYTNDLGTPGHLNWEINLGYMPFFYSNQSVFHVPDLDIDFGVGARIQLTYENALLRVQNPATKFGIGQSNPGLKWRFYDGGESGLAKSVLQGSVRGNTRLTA